MGLQLSLVDEFLALRAFPEVAETVCFMQLKLAALELLVAVAAHSLRVH